MEYYNREIDTDCVVNKPDEGLPLALADWECETATCVKILEIVLGKLRPALVLLEREGFILVVTSLQFHVFRFVLAIIASDCVC